MTRQSPPVQDIFCQQVLREDASVFSSQWSIFPERLAAGLTSDMLLERYLDHLRSCTAGLIRPCSTADGVELRMIFGATSLISFLPPDRERTASTLRISGGVLVQPGRRDRGQLRFGVERMDDGIRVSLELSGYFPLLLGNASPSWPRFHLYRLTQSLIHRLVTVHFLTQLYRELAGAAKPARLVNVKARNGRPL